MSVIELLIFGPFFYSGHEVEEVSSCDAVPLCDEGNFESIHIVENVPKEVPCIGCFPSLAALDHILYRYVEVICHHLFGVLY